LQCQENAGFKSIRGKQADFDSPCAIRDSSKVHKSFPGLIVADTNWHSTRNLLATWPPESSPDSRLLSMEPIDWQNAKNRGIPFWNWRLRRSNLSPGHDLMEAILPPGWMKKWPAAGQWPLARACRKWLRKNDISYDETLLWVTYPFYLELARQLKPSRLVYYNLDDYELYWPAQWQKVREWEAKTIATADFTVCVAAHQAEKFRRLYPARAERIFHLPHAAPEWSIPDSPRKRPAPLPDQLAHIPQPIFGYIGGLEDRLDWQLILRLAQEFPDCSILLVGPRPAEGDGQWQKTAAEAMKRENVYAPGCVSQREIANIYAAFDLNMIPYDVSHPFNVACSPTKLLDAMGSGRPTVATALPECRLYGKLYHIAESEDAFIEKLHELKKMSFDDGLHEQRWAYASSRRSGVILDALFRFSWAKDAKEARHILESLGPIG
jgi:hypothetical protein